MLDFHCPTRIVFGTGQLSTLGSLAQELGGRRLLVVSDPGVVAAGHTARGIDLLHAAGLATRLFDRVEENPTTEHVDQGLAMAQAYQPEAIVAIGGGSSMDCAKGINFLYSCGGSMQDYWGVGKATGPMLPMMAVPTTAGTGSETQSFALISDAVTHTKMACGDRRAAFRIALLDPELTLTQPARVTALTGIDAISHAVETGVTKSRTPISLALSRQAWSLLMGALQRVLLEPNDLAARGDVQLGASLAGMAIESSMLGSAHALANPLTAACDIAHGEAVSLMLPHVVRHNGQLPEVARAYAEMLGDLAPAIRSPEEAPHQLAELLSHLAQQAGLATKLSDCGVDAAQLSDLATHATQQWTGTFNPVAMRHEDYLQLYRAAY